MAKPSNKVHSDDEIFQAVSDIRAHHSKLNREQVRVILRTQYHCSVSESRLKKLLPATIQPLQGRKKAARILDRRFNLILSEPRPEQILFTSYASDKKLREKSQRLQIPENALAAQTKYRSESRRIFKIYGYGEYNFGVLLHPDMAILFDRSYKKIQKATRLVTEQDRSFLAKKPYLQTIWDFYVAAANKAGVTKAEIGTQFEIEYGVPWKLMPMAKSEWTGPEAAASRAKYKEESLKAMRQEPQGTSQMMVDESGEIIWNEKMHGQFAMILVKTEK